MFLPPPVCFPIYKSAQPGKETGNGHRHITPVNNTLDQRLARAFPHVPPTNRDCESAVIPIKIGKPLGHFDEDLEIFRICKATLGSTVRSDDRHTALQRQSQQAWITVSRLDDRYRVFTACVRQQ